MTDRFATDAEHAASDIRPTERHAVTEHCAGSPPSRRRPADEHRTRDRANGLLHGPPTGAMPSGVYNTDAEATATFHRTLLTSQRTGRGAPTPPKVHHAAERTRRRPTLATMQRTPATPADQLNPTRRLLRPLSVCL